MTKIKHVLPALFLAGLLASPALATDFGIYGSFWDTDALGETAGGGVKLGFGEGLVRFEVRGSYFPDLSEDFDQLIEDGELETGDFEVKATVPEAGITFNFAPESRFQPYVGVGGSYYSLDTNRFELDDEIGYYGVAGFHVGGADGGPAFFAEAMYRKADATIQNDDINDPDDFQGKVELDLSGFSANAGILFRF